MDSLYQENILDHYKNPRNYGERENWVAKDGETIFISGQNNPSCGDSLEVAVWVVDNKITKFRFVGQGCAISMASASMLGEKIVGVNLEEARKIDFEEVEIMLGVLLSSERKKCAYLSLMILKKILFS
jgi:nitrogen fixation NifU-like protein